MAGVNSLGIGSGVLTADLIDKLKEADTKAVVNPIKDKIANMNAKEDAHKLLKELMSTFQGSSLALGGDSLYLDRSVNGGTDAVSVSAESGAIVQSFSITDVDKAEADVWNSKVFTSKSEFLKTDTSDPMSEGTLSISFGNVGDEDYVNYDIEYTATSSLSDIRDSINEVASDKMTASILQVGDDSYELILTAKETNEPMTFTDSNGTDANSLSTILELNNMQPAEAATFKYNGIDVSRSSNDISDLITGVTINLNKNQEASDTAFIDIVQNDVSIKTEMDLFVTNYNTLMSNLKDMTSSDTSKGTIGVFNNDYMIKNISREIVNLVTSEDSNGNSLMDYGIEIDKKGVMSLDSATYEAKYKENPEAMEDIFVGSGDEDGLFKKLDNTMNGYLDNDGLLSIFGDSMETSQKSLQSQYDRQVKVLDDRYELMTKRFQAYDSIINSMNNSFNSLKMTIDALSADNN